MTKYLFLSVCMSYLEQAGVEQQCVCRLSVVLTLQVKVPQLVQVPDHTHTRVKKHTHTVTVTEVK